MITRVKTLNSKEYAWSYPTSDDKINSVTDILTAIDYFRYLLARDHANYYTTSPHSPIISARKRIFRNILAGVPFEPSNINSAFLYLKITDSLNSDEGGGFSPVALRWGYIKRLNLERAKKKAMASSAWVFNT